MFSFLQNRSTFYSIAIVLGIISLFALLFLPKNLGIDLTGGTQLEYECEASKCDVEKVRSVVDTITKAVTQSGTSVINGSNVYKITGQNAIVIETGFDTAKKLGISEGAVDTFKTQFREQVTAELVKQVGFTLVRHVNIGESFGAYIKTSAFYTLILAIITISIYIQYAFRGSIAHVASWPFAIVTGVSLLHDVLIAVGFYIIISYFFPEYKIDTFSLTAVLTVLGYSINDTIVVMDRIRSNLHDMGKRSDLAHIIDSAIRDTLTRSLFTSLTIIIVLFAMFFFGPSTLHGFMLMLIVGTFVGTYSSICIAAPLLYDIIKNRK
jgi:preprotein translocase SecF subunit